MKEYLDMIVEKGKTEDMDCLGDMMIDLLHHMKDTNHEKYEKYKTKIIGMAYGYKITKDLAEDIVKSMRPKGEYWSMDDIKNAVGDLQNLPEVYVVMNSLVNDYGDVISPEDVDTYIKLTNAWINDSDGHENKTWWYFVTD